MAINKYSNKLINFLRIIFTRTKIFYLLWFFISIAISFAFVLLIFDGNFHYFLPLIIFFFLIIGITCYLQLLGIWYNIDIMNRLLSKITNSDVNFTTELNKFNIKALRNSITFLSSAFQKLILQIEITRENIYFLSRELTKTTKNIYRGVDKQKVTTSFVVQSSLKIDDLLCQIEDQVRLVEKNTSETIQTSKDIESNSEGIYMLVEELISLIGNAEYFLDQTQKSLQENEKVIGEISSFINYISQSAHDLNSISETIEQNVSSTVKFQKMVLEEVQKSEKVIHSYSHSIDSIRNTILSTNKTIEMLSKDSDQINLIIEAIETISRQTSLLSLNASIIAAISKESGKSFNVVADEIRLLSEKTELSTRDIFNIIANIKESIKNSKVNIDKSFSIVDKAEEHSQNIYESLYGILDLAENSITSIQDIQHSTVSQLQNFQIIVRTTEDINKQCIDIKNKNNTLQSEFVNLKNVAQKLSNISNGLKNKIHNQLYDAKEIIGYIQEINEKIISIYNISSDIAIQRESIEKSFSEIEKYSENNLLTLGDLTLSSFNMSSEYNKLETLTDFYKGLIPKKGGELIINYRFTDYPVIDPALLTSTEKIIILTCIYETLLTYTSSADVKPLLCDKYEVSQDGARMTFYLKKNVYFHNGQHMTAKDVKYSFERLKYVYSTNKPKLMQFLGPIEGFDDFISGAEDCLRGIVIIDDYTIEIHLSKPLVYYIKALCQVELSIVPYMSYHTLIPRPNGTGPFSFKKYAEKDYLLLSRNEKYHIPELPYADYIRFQDNVSYLDLIKGTLHILSSVTIPDPDLSIYITSRNGVIIEPIEIYSTNSLLLNTTIPPFSCKFVRQAFMLAIDREKMIKDVYAGHANKAESFIPPGILAHSPRKDLIRYDIDSAKMLIEKSPLSFPMEIDYYSYKGFLSDLTKFLLQCLKELGIESKIIELDDDEYLKQAKNNIFNLIAWHADYLDPDNFIFPIFHSKNIENLGWVSGWKSYYLDELIESAQYEQDVVKRRQLYYEGEEILFSEVPAIPLSYNKQFLAHSHDLICTTKSVSPYFDPKLCWFFLKDK